MRIVVKNSSEEAADFSTEFMVQAIRGKSDITLGLATGSSPVRTYEKLIERHKNNDVSFQSVTTFNLDEYMGLKGDHPQSYRFYMNEKLFNHIDIDLSNTHVLDGISSDPLQACSDFESLIKAQEGIDLQLLGIGRNGHIGFNEPTSSLTSRTRVKTLTKDTVDANKRYFAEDEYQPHLAMTMGIGTIMEAKQILLLATGEGKAQAIKDMVEGPLAARCPASILQMHMNATIVIDRDAARLLNDVAFYEYIEQERKQLMSL